MTLADTMGQYHETEGEVTADREGGLLRYKQEIAQWRFFFQVGTLNSIHCL